ncbi:phage tail assembly protein [Variovorax ureilyticus]|uniref:phage tail assembly protein n=1 Tax=Variovorax ureilyticus TaxID=1836198 RepID=UPI003D66822D
MNTKDHQPNAQADNTDGAATQAAAPNTVVLDTPIQRGATTITEITLRKPNSGELRGLSLQRLHQADADEIMKLLPRISSPTLTPPECAELDPADLSEFGGHIISFLLKKSVRDVVLSTT